MTVGEGKRGAVHLRVIRGAAEAVLRAAKAAEAAALKARKAVIEKTKKVGGSAQWRAAVFEG